MPERLWPERLSKVGSAVLGSALLALAGCAGGTDPRAGDLGFQWQVKSYYADRATESQGRCTRPMIRTITDVVTLEETDGAVVKEIRYAWHDESVRRNLRRPQLSGGSMSCQGFESRTFTFARLSNGRLEVVDMGGERRTVQQNFNVGGAG